LRQRVDELEAQIAVKSRGLVGNVMIYDLCLMVVEFLEAHNVKPLKSMHDAMLKASENKKEEEKVLF